MDPRYSGQSASSSASPYATHNSTQPSRSPFPPQLPPQYHHDRSPPTAGFGPHSRHPSDAAFPTDRPSHSRANSQASARDREYGQNMPPPNSPPGGAHHQQHPHQQQQPPHAMPGYGSGPPPRAPPVGPGHSAFGSGRELPALGSIARAGPAGGSMSISSLLGGPGRESQPPPHQYPPHSAAPPGSGPGQGFPPPAHGSPRMQSASTDYSPFRRPHTPDRTRPYDPRASAAPSPRGPYGTPEVPRYGTPHSYHARHMSASADPSRDPARMSAASAPPPRPNSQPKYPGMPRPGEDRYGRRDDMPRPYPGTEYNPERAGLRPYSYDERYRAERERQNEIEAREQERREFARRERAYSGSDSGRHPHHGREPQREPPPNQPPYGRPPDGRDPRDGHWGRPGSDPSFRAPMDYPRQHPEYPPHSSAPYPPHGAPYQPSHAERYPPVSQSPNPHSYSPQAPPPQDSPDRARMSLHPQHQQPQHPQQRPAPPGRPEEGPHHGSAYNGGQGPPPYEAQRHRNSDDASAVMQRKLLAVQQENRKGRISPLPQAVQGAQPQQPGPGAEPGIKSEFGRMFSGIGSGVSGLGGSSPITGQAGPFTNAALAKRDDLDGADSGPDNAKGQKGRRRKLKEEDGRDDESSGRLTPGHKAKRAKGHQHHHHQYVISPRRPSGSADSRSHNHHHHHHHHHKNDDDSQSGTPLRNTKGNGPGADGDKTGGPHHHHHHHHGGRVPSGQKAAPNAMPQIPPRTKTIVSSDAVLEAAAKHKRQHLGDWVYETELKPQRLVPNTPVYRGFSSSPKPLPMAMVKDKINCTLTVKVPRIHLSRTSREEITARGFLWGTDVYSDDSDVVAACIHSGWIKGEWNDDVDVAMLDLDTNKSKGSSAPADPQSEQLITSPPDSGPMDVPYDRDLHVNVLVLPRLSRYASTTRYGITSREFGGDFGSRHVCHDGLSYMIHGIRWVENGGQPQARLRGKGRRERMRKAMQEVRSFSVGNVNGKSTSGQVDERSQIKGDWWRKEHERTEGERERKGSEGDKENRAAEKATSEESKGGEKDAEMVDSPPKHKDEAKE